MNTQFGYNGDGVRLRLVAADTLTTYTQDYAAPLPVVLPAKTGTTTTQYVYSMGTRPLGEYEAAAWEYLLPDPLGSVRQIANSNADVTLLKSYEPYGSVLNSQGSATSVFGYAGEQADAYTGLIYLRARYMQPGLGIFLSRDPVPTLNGFNYADSNPINRVDPSGLFSAVTLARSQGYSADLEGVMKWFESNRDYWGWTSLLLDAESGDSLAVWGVKGSLGVATLWGIFNCRDGKAQLEPTNNMASQTLDKPKFLIDAWWWRSQGVYSLASASGYPPARVYRDGGDSGAITDLPDISIIGLGFNPASGAVIADRYGRLYFSVGVGIKGPPAYYVSFGEGYIGKGNIWNGYSGFIQTPEEMQTAVTGISFALGAFLAGGGGQVSINACDPTVIGGHLFGTCYAALVYMLGGGFSLGVSGSLTFELDERDPRFGWDWMFHIPAPSRTLVWNRAFESYLSDPCGECSGQ